ncbi:hypothetical protein PF005_g2788 [Phytophthora fragariae]|uniref:Uncharacterized protein n=1 Tax=Phytophthora fragariae TaxID=53985 RepID=A0A6A3TE84_9STRA|nr:hypothetical protein PF003_g11865 [Phytophthora fragariae]KAE8947299.1 hypothetical protein PF009_g3113 [Phytophthora fragariae]KAE9027569.1 hypothetical protein PF011_g2002 [Phytophthora fragariae]KAE9134311.1 hypothetical protein PF010_g2504 [Phytophthora fragariae]KAE9134957.1 hypothetical protein PF007_g2743 [Phytophthora fragariae]
MRSTFSSSSQPSRLLVLAAAPHPSCDSARSSAFPICEPSSGHEGVGLAASRSPRHFGREQQFGRHF